MVADSRIPFTNAAGQTISVPSHFSNLAEAAKDFVRRVCDAETKRIEAQQSVELEQQKILLGWLGNIGAFLQGTGTAIYDDAMGPLSNLYNDLTITSGFDTGLGTDYVPPVREPFMGKQDAMAWGRGFGHILTVVLGAATEVITIGTSAGLAGGSIALALPTGGTVTVPGVAAAGTVLVSGSVAAGSIVKAGVEGLFNDPNMQFSSNGEASSTGRGVGGKGWRGDKTWKQNVRTISEGGTIYDLNGQVPTQQEAIDLIEEAGGTVKRIEGPHNAPNPHNFNHINYTTPGGEKGTIRIQ